MAVRPPPPPCSLLGGAPGIRRLPRKSYQPARHVSAHLRQSRRLYRRAWRYRRVGAQAGRTFQGLTYGSYRHHAPDSIADFIMTQNGQTIVGDLAHGFIAFGAWDDPSTPQIESCQFAAATYYTGHGLELRPIRGRNQRRPAGVSRLVVSRPLGHATLGVGYDNTDGKHNVIVHDDLAPGTAGMAMVQRNVIRLRPKRR